MTYQPSPTPVFARTDHPSPFSTPVFGAKEPNHVDLWRQVEKTASDHREGFFVIDDPTIIERIFGYYVKERQKITSLGELKDNHPFQLCADDLCRRAKVAPHKVFFYGSEFLNAIVMTRAVFLSDQMLIYFSTDAILGALAHEIGHSVLYKWLPQTEKTRAQNHFVEYCADALAALLVEKHKIYMTLLELPECGAEYTHPANADRIAAVNRQVFFNLVRPLLQDHPPQTAVNLLSEIYDALGKPAVEAKWALMSSAELGLLGPQLLRVQTAEQRPALASLRPPPGRRFGWRALFRR